MIRKLKSKMDAVKYGVPAFFASHALMSTAASAQATTTTVKDVSSLADQLGTQLGSVGKLILGGAFVAGLAFVGLGIMKLKAANDSQGQQAKYGDGVWRICLGAALVGLPAVLAIGTGTFGLTQSGGGLSMGTASGGGGMFAK